MTKLTNCSIIASRRSTARRRQGQGPRGACTTRGHAATSPTFLLLPPNSSLRLKLAKPTLPNSNSGCQPSARIPPRQPQIRAAPGDPELGRNARREPRGPAGGERGGCKREPPQGGRRLRRGEVPRWGNGGSRRSEAAETGRGGREVGAECGVALAWEM
jgi:hypothetical protein